MSRTLTASMTAHLAGTVHKRASMLRLDLIDGSTLAVTDHDKAIAYDLGDGEATYSPRTGILPSDLTLSAGFDADEVEVTGPLVETATEAWHVTKAAVLGGRYDEAVARYFQVNWSNLSAGAIKLLQGRVVLAEVQGSAFRFTIRSDIDRFKQQIGRTITAYCDADFGDARCGATPVTVSATVTAVTDARNFTVSFAGSYADSFFRAGTVSFDTGALAGTRPVEIQGWTAAGVIELWAELAEPPGVGDTLTIRQGCYDLATNTSKTRPACKAFNNIANFRGFPDVPGTDQVLRYPNPAT